MQLKAVCCVGKKIKFCCYFIAIYEVGGTPEIYKQKECIERVSERVSVRMEEEEK